MKKNLLSLSIAAAVGGLTMGGAAQAGVAIIGTGTGTGTLSASNATYLDVNPGGIGHIVVVPYFSASNGNVTLLSITNTDATNGKLAKVRFRSSLNSDDVFDFTLFLSPNDVWTGSVSQSAAAPGLALMNTGDNSCTLPASINGTFVTDRLPPVGGLISADTQAALTREGYIEILNMANVPPADFGSPTAPSTTNPLFTAIKHVNGVAPCSAAASATAFGKLATDPTSEADARAKGLDTPSGGLYATSVIVNTANAFVAWSTETTAVNAVVAQTNKVAGRGNLVFSPQTNEVFTGDLTLLTADPLFLSGKLTPRQFDFPDLSTAYGIDALTFGANNATANANALSFTLAVNSISNDYTAAAPISSKTDLVFAFPTRRYGVAVDYAASAATTGNPLVFNAPSAFTTTGNLYFTSSNTSLQSATGIGRYVGCVSPGVGPNGSAITAYDRSEQGGSTTSFVISPGTGTTSFAFCGEVSVSSVNNPAPGTTVLGSQIARSDITSPFNEGWLRIQTPGLTGNGAPTGNRGLPILGGAYSSAKGPVAADRSTNFGYTARHKFILTNPN